MYILLSILVHRALFLLTAIVDRLLCDISTVSLVLHQTCVYTSMLL